MSDAPPTVPRVTSPEPFTPPSGHPDLAAVTEELKERLAPRIQLLEVLGAGGMGVVFLGRDPLLHRSVAVKVLAPALASDPDAQMRFTREAQAAAAIAHPNVINIFEVGDLPKSGLSYFVMQFVEGDSLAAAYAGQALSDPAVRRIVGEIAGALAAAHARNVIHRDNKPANIKLERESGRAIVLDFGISAVLEHHPDPSAAGATVTSTGAIGTPSHMSPEQALGRKVTDRTDVYSLGVVAFELATGRPPFEEVTPIGMVDAHIHESPPPVHQLRPDLDRRLAALIDRCLSKDPGARPSAGELARYLLPGTETAVEWPPPGLEHVRETGRKLFASLRALTLLVVLFFAAIYAQPRLATVSWREGETSPFWRTVWAPYAGLQTTFVESVECRLVNETRGVEGAQECATRQQVDATPLWFFNIVLAGVASLLAAANLTRRAVRLTKESRVARGAGYPWRVIGAVAADEGLDTAELVNGSGRYATLGASERNGLLRLRRLASLAILGAAIVAFMLPFVWTRMVPAGGANATEWLTGREMALLATPLLLLAGAFALGIPERRARRRGPRVSGAGMPVVRRELVDGWLAASSGVAALPRSIPRVLMVHVPIGLAAAVLLLIVLTTLGISAFSIWSSPMLRDWVSAWREGRRAVAAAPTSHVRWATIDYQVSQLALSPADMDANGALPRVSAVRLSVSGDRRSAIVAAGDWDSLPARPAAARVNAIARDTAALPLDRFRRLARTAPRWQRGGDPFRTSQQLVQSEWVLPYASRNAGAAYLAMLRGDPATAERRLRENVTVGRLAWRSMNVATYGDGSRIVREALYGLAAVARLRANLELAQRAREVHDAVDTYRWSNVVIVLGWAPLVMADPRDSSGVAEIRNRGNAPAVRRELLRGAVDGYCYNGRELLFGVSPLRRGLLASAARAARDLPGIDSMVARDRSRLAAVVALRGVRGVRERSRRCPDW